MNVKSWSITDVGSKRDHNEDSLLTDDALGLWIVADGMGGHQAGETASRVAVATVADFVEQGLAWLSPAPPQGGTRQMLAAASEAPEMRLLTEALQAASGAILDRVREDSSLNGMGTTLVALLIHEGQGFFAHVGDSRLYRLRDGEISQLSRDHSLVQQQIDAGLITRSQAQNSAYRNIITRSVGFERNIDVDCESLDVRGGDVFLLCSDGLSNLVSEKELAEIILRKDPPTALNFFVNLANSRGGDDNITAVLVCVDPT